MADAAELNPGQDTVLTANVRQARIARVYAESLAAVAEKQGQVEEVGNELVQFVANVLKTPKIAAFFASKSVNHVSAELLSASREPERSLKELSNAPSSFTNMSNAALGP